MKRFYFFHSSPCLESSKDSEKKPYATHCIETLLEKFGCKIVRDKPHSYSVPDMMQEDAYAGPYIYDIVYAHTVHVEVVDENTTEKDLDDLRRILCRILSQSITFSKEA